MKKRKKISSPLSFRRPRRKRRVGSSDVIGIILIFVAVFIFVSLISYDSQDPSWTNTGWADAQPSEQKIHNYIGKAGAYLSDAAIQLFGFTSFLLAIALFYMGIQCFSPHEERRLLLKSMASLFLILVFSSLLFMLFGTVSWTGAEIQAGGLIGRLISSALIQIFSRVGTLLVLVVLLILFFILATKIPISVILRFFSDLFKFVFKEVRIKVTHYRKARLRERMRKKVVEKYSPPEEKETKKPWLKKRKREVKIEPKPESQLTKPATPTVQEKYIFPEMEKKTDYNYPPFTLLDPGKTYEKIDKNELYEKKQRIEKKLAEFRVEGEVREYHPGPVVTTYEFYPYPGIKISQVANLADDLSMALGAESARVQRMPGKSK